MTNSERASSGYLLSPQDGKCRAYDVGVDAETALDLSKVTPVSDISGRTKQHILEKGGIVNGEPVTSPQNLYVDGPLAYDASKTQPSSQPETEDNTEKKERLVAEISGKIIDALRKKFPKLDGTVRHESDSETGWIDNVITLDKEVLREMEFGVDMMRELDILPIEQRKGASPRLKFVTSVFKRVNEIVQENCFKDAGHLFMVYVMPGLPNFDPVMIRLYDHSGSHMNKGPYIDFKGFHQARLS